MASAHKSNGEGKNGAATTKSSKLNPLPGRKPSKALLTALEAVEATGKKKKTS